MRYIASFSTYTCQSVGQSVIVSDLEISIASPSFASLFNSFSLQCNAMRCWFSSGSQIQTNVRSNMFSECFPECFLETECSLEQSDDSQNFWPRKKIICALQTSQEFTSRQWPQTVMDLRDASLREKCGKFLNGPPLHPKFIVSTSQRMNTNGWYEQAFSQLQFKYLNN